MKGLRILLALAVTFIVTSSLGIAFAYMFDTETPPLFDNRVAFPREFLYVCVFAPIVEEFLFRWTSIELFRKFKFWDKIKWPWMVIASCIFGLAHGDYFNIFVQGVVGFACAWVYIKNNYSFWSAVTLHFLWNMVMCVIGPTFLSYVV